MEGRKADVKAGDMDMCLPLSWRRAVSPIVGGGVWAMLWSGQCSANAITFGSCACELGLLAEALKELVSVPLMAKEVVVDWLHMGAGKMQGDSVSVECDVWHWLCKRLASHLLGDGVSNSWLKCVKSVVEGGGGGWSSVVIQCGAMVWYDM